MNRPLARSKNWSAVVSAQANTTRSKNMNMAKDQMQLQGVLSTYMVLPFHKRIRRKKRANTQCIGRVYLDNRVLPSQPGPLNSHSPESDVIFGHVCNGCRVKALVGRPGTPFKTIRAAAGDEVGVSNVGRLLALRKEVNVSPHALLLPPSCTWLMLTNMKRNKIDQGRHEIENRGKTHMMRTLAIKSNNLRDIPSRLLILPNLPM